MLSDSAFPTFGLGLVEDTAAKAFDQLFDRGVLGTVCVILLLAIIVGGLVIRHLHNQGNARIVQHEADAKARVAQHDALLERVIVVAEGYKAAVTQMASAVDGMKSVQSSMLQAVSDLARESEGEAREAKHLSANIMQVVTANLRILEKIDDRRRAG